MGTKATIEYNASHAKDKLSFNAYRRPGVNIIKTMQKELEHKQQNLIKKIRINLTGTPMYKANISICRFFYWTSNPRENMRSMTRAQYKTYHHKKRLPNQSAWDRRLLWGVTHTETEKINPFSGEPL